MLNDAIEVLGWTLLHFVWQGAVIGVLAAGLLVALRRQSANARYLAAVSALGLMLLLPLGTIAWIEPTHPIGDVAPLFNTVSTIEVPRTRDDGTLALDEPPIKVERIGIDFENPPPARAVPLIPVDETGRTIFEDLAEQSTNSKVASFLEPCIPWCVAMWLIGVAVLSLRLFGSWWSVQRLRRKATQPAGEPWQAALRQLANHLRVTRPVKLVESALVEVPAVIGWLRPIILLPATAMTGLTTEQLEALLAHVRRHDYLINLLQTVIETLLFYHPAVWWLSHRIRIEREHCCDDLAANVCGDRLTYAKALLAMEELRASPLGFALSARGGSLLSRVARLLRPTESQRQPVGWIAGLIVMLSLTVAVAFGAGLLNPTDKPTESLPNGKQRIAMKSNDKNEENFGLTQRRVQKTRAERDEVKADVEWSQEHNGLRTRLTLLSEEPVVGRLVVKLEVQNVGMKEQSYQWMNRVAARYFRIIGLDGKDVEDLTASLHARFHPIRVRPTVIKPGETSVLLEFYDLAERFLLAKPGQYQIRFGRSVDGELAGKFKNTEGEGVVPIPEPNPLTVQLGEGELPEIQAFALRMRTALPDGWKIGVLGPDEPRREDKAHLGLHFDPTNQGMNGELLVLGFFTEGTASQKFENNDVMSLDLGPTKFGRAHLVFTWAAKAAWPNCTEQIRDLLPREDKSDTDRAAPKPLPKNDLQPQSSINGLGKFSGRVKLKTDKPLPDLSKVQLPAGKVLDESLVFSKDGGLANVFVYLPKPAFPVAKPAASELSRPFVLMSEGGTFRPHVALVRVGQSVVFENGDNSVANFHTFPQRNVVFNFSVAMVARVDAPEFKHPEKIPFAVKSDFKPWMQAYLLPLDHPFAAVTDTDGRFEIKGLPPGEHEFRVWHERAANLEKSLKVTIKSDEDATPEWTYAPNRFELTEDDVQRWGRRTINVQAPGAIAPRQRPAQPKIETPKNQN